MDVPKYKELKRRCDFCDHEFKNGEMIAALRIRFERGSRDYTTIFCYNGDDVIPKCLRLWRMKYEVQCDMDWDMMVYEGKRRGGSGGTGRFDPVPI